jgi:hypothetical protein
LAGRHRAALSNWRAPLKSLETMSMDLPHYAILLGFGILLALAVFGRRM